MTIALDRHIAPLAPLQNRILATADVDPGILALLRDHGMEIMPIESGQLAAWPSEDIQPCVILWRDPTALVATALLAGADPVAACDGWLADSRRLLELHRRNRRQLQLVDAALLAPGAPEAQREALRARLGVPALPPPVPTAADPARQMVQRLARLILAQIATVRDCLEAMQTASLAPPPQELEAFDLAALSRGMAERSAQAGKLTEHAALLETQLELQKQDSARQVAALEARLQKATHEADQALARALADLRDEARRRKKAEQRVKALAGQLEKTFASTSWRMTRPLRGVRSLLGGGGRSSEEAFLETRKHETGSN